jgi:hypothetical protein
MSVIKHLIDDPRYHNLTFIIKPIVQKSIGNIISDDIGYDNYKKIIDILDKENDDCVKSSYTNRIFHYRDLIMIIDSDKNKREYYQEKQHLVEIVDNLLINVIKKSPIEKHEFPMINNYDAEYTEHLIMYRKSPLIISLCHKNNKYNIKISFELRPLREKYIDSKLDKIIKLISL